MKRLHIIFSLIALVLCVVQASAERYALRSQAFTTLNVDGPCRVECRANADSAGVVTFDATTEARRKVAVSSTGTTLSIRVLPDVNPTDLSVITVYYNTPLNTLTLHGPCILTAEGLPQTRSLAVSVRGSSVATIKGVRTATFNISVSGAGIIEVEGVNCASVSASVTGSGQVTVDGVTASRANATVSGSGMASLEGSAESGSFAVKGSGIVSASRLLTNDVRASVTGSGSITYNGTATKVQKSGRQDRITPGTSPLQQH